MSVFLDEEFGDVFDAGPGLLAGGDDAAGGQHEPGSHGVGTALQGIGVLDTRLHLGPIVGAARSLVEDVRRRTHLPTRVVHRHQASERGDGLR